MHAPDEYRIVPVPWKEIPPSTAPLTSVRYTDVMHAALEQCCGLAEVCAVAATHPDGLPDGLAAALAILEHYTACALALYERWHAPQHAGPVVSPEEATHDDPC